MTGEGEPTQVMWEGQYIRAMKRGRWEYASRTRNVTAVVILAEIDGKVLLVDQPRVPTGKRCIELPAGLVGDIDADATIEGTAVKELEEETGYTADAIERIGVFYSSPGMIAEDFTLVRASGLRKVGDGGGDDSEDINVHLVAPDDIPAFIERKRAEGFGIDVRLMLFLKV